MNEIVLSLFSRKSPTGKPSAKNYPWPEELVSLLRENGYKTIQIGVEGEPDINADLKYFGLKFKDLQKLCLESFTWISVDNFLPHMMQLTDKKGVVAWGKSDPKIFGYPNNINLLKSGFYLRPNQFSLWFDEHYVTQAFVEPKVILEAVKQITV